MQEQSPATRVAFLIAGTQKGGTSTLDAYCREHPALCMAREKELHFFDRDDNFPASDAAYAQYHAGFPPWRGRLPGESTPIYMYWPTAPARIRDYNPAMKFIVILRHPVDRAFSHWHMETARGHENLPFGEAIRREGGRLGTDDGRRVYSYIDRGLYMGQLERLWALFGREQVLALRHETLRDAPETVLRAISDFLGVAAFPRVDARAENAQSYTLVMPDADRQFLDQCFAPDIDRLEAALGWDCTAWKARGVSS